MPRTGASRGTVSDGSSPRIGELAGQALEALGRAGVVARCRSGPRPAGGPGGSPRRGGTASRAARRRARPRRGPRRRARPRGATCRRLRRRGRGRPSRDRRRRRTPAPMPPAAARARPRARPCGVDHARRTGTERSPTTRNGCSGSATPLTTCGARGLDLEVAVDQLPDLVGDDDRPRIGERVQPRADVGREAVDVVLVQVEVDRAVMHGDADVERLAGAARSARARPAPARAPPSPRARRRSRGPRGSRRSTASRRP